MRDKWDIPAQVDGHDTVCFTFQVPDVDEYRRAFYGALEALTKEEFWQSENPEIRGAAATYWSDLLFFQGFKDCETGGGGAEVDPPFWDDEENADGDGQGTRWGFTEAADWVTTAFLAIAVNPGAAMFYKTVIPRGRIALKTHDLGGLARILIDGIFAIDVDTAADVPGVEGVVQVNIDFEQFAADNGLVGAERTITIEKVG